MRDRAASRQTVSIQERRVRRLLSGEAVFSMMWQRMDQVPDGVEVVNIYSETLIGSFVVYGRDVQQAEREQYAGPFTDEY